MSPNLVAKYRKVCVCQRCGRDIQWRQDKEKKGDGKLPLQPYCPRHGSYPPLLWGYEEIKSVETDDSPKETTNA